MDAKWALPNLEGSTRVDGWQRRMQGFEWREYPHCDVKSRAAKEKTWKKRSSSSSKTAFCLRVYLQILKRTMAMRRGFSGYLILSCDKFAMRAPSSRSTRRIYPSRGSWVSYSSDRAKTNGTGTTVIHLGKIQESIIERRSASAVLWKRFSDNGKSGEMEMGISGPATRSGVRSPY